MREATLTKALTVAFTKETFAGSIRMIEPDTESEIDVVEFSGIYVYFSLSVCF